MPVNGGGSCFKIQFSFRYFNITDYYDEKWVWYPSRHVPAMMSICAL